MAFRLGNCTLLINEVPVHPVFQRNQRGKSDSSSPTLDLIPVFTLGGEKLKGVCGSAFSLLSVGRSLSHCKNSWIKGLGDSWKKFCGSSFISPDSYLVSCSKSYPQINDSCLYLNLHSFFPHKKSLTKNEIHICLLLFQYCGKAPRIGWFSLFLCFCPPIWFCSLLLFLCLFPPPLLFLSLN